MSVSTDAAQTIGVPVAGWRYSAVDRAEVVEDGTEPWQSEGLRCKINGASLLREGLSGRRSPAPRSRRPRSVQLGLVRAPCWRKYKRDHNAALTTERSTGESVEDDVIRERITVNALRLVRNEDARKALALAGYGYTYPEIARWLGKTPKAVERMLAYARVQVEKGEEKSA